MKRRLFQTILALAMTLGMIGTNVFASTLAETADTSADGVIVNETIEYLPDGSSIVITVIDETSIMPLATTFTKTGSKVYSARNPDGVIMWQFTVHGTFSVNSGVSATCTAASHSINIVEDAWQNQSASTSRSGNKAIGNATFIKKLLFITVDTKDIQVTLTCDSNGNLS